MGLCSKTALLLLFTVYLSHDASATPEKPVVIPLLYGYACSSPDFEPGMKVEWFENKNCAGEPVKQSFLQIWRENKKSKKLSCRTLKEDETQPSECSAEFVDTIGIDSQNPLVEVKIYKDGDTDAALQCKAVQFSKKMYLADDCAKGWSADETQKYTVEDDGTTATGKTMTAVFLHDVGDGKSLVVLAIDGNPLSSDFQEDVIFDLIGTIIMDALNMVEKVEADVKGLGAAVISMHAGDGALQQADKPCGNEQICAGEKTIAAFCLPKNVYKILRSNVTQNLDAIPGYAKKDGTDPKCLQTERLTPLSWFKDPAEIMAFKPGILCNTAKLTPKMRASWFSDEKCTEENLIFKSKSSFWKFPLGSGAYQKSLYCQLYDGDEKSGCSKASTIYTTITSEAQEEEFINKGLKIIDKIEMTQSVGAGTNDTVCENVVQISDDIYLTDDCAKKFTADTDVTIKLGSTSETKELKTKLSGSTVNLLALSFKVQEFENMYPEYIFDAIGTIITEAVTAEDVNKGSAYMIKAADPGAELVDKDAAECPEGTICAGTSDEDSYCLPENVIFTMPVKRGVNAGKIDYLNDKCLQTSRFVEETSNGVTADARDTNNASPTGSSVTEKSNNSVEAQTKPDSSGGLSPNFPVHASFYTAAATAAAALTACLIGLF